MATTDRVTPRIIESVVDRPPGVGVVGPGVGVVGAGVVAADVVMSGWCEVRAGVESMPLVTLDDVGVVVIELPVPEVGVLAVAVVVAVTVTVVVVSDFTDDVSDTVLTSVPAVPGVCVVIAV
eukprot:GHVT01071870.1.p2 GENE.GHVT01071870.1~~GHVT01071870.1.p2  ORF type:complete len:122 (+),score=4.76 GHVT01071870.1:168-533(+)